MTNSEIAKILYEIGEYLEMQGVAFKPRAYSKVAQAIESLEEPVSETYKKGGLKAVENIPGVGVSIAEKIEELLKTGKLKYYEGLKKKTPVDLESLTKIEGLGPKKIKILYQKLKVKNLESLEKAARSGKIGKLEGFGEKSEQNILKGLEFAKKNGGRFLLGSIYRDIKMIEDRLSELPGVTKVRTAGSIRRRKETVGDADILVITKNPVPVMEYFANMPEVARVLAKGDTRSSITLKNGMDVDLRVVDESSYGSALNYFTGSKDHNIYLRQLAIKKGLKLSEYGVFKGKKQVAGKTEEDVYEALGLDYIEPEMREMQGEIEAARKHRLPKLINYGDLQGDLQVQSNWTDGEKSIEDMAMAAVKVGLKYIAITDHTKRLAMTHGLDEKRIIRQMKEIDTLNKKLRGKITLLKGSECDILKDGSLDLPDEILKRLDVVGASVHSLFDLPEAEQTKRIQRSIRNPNVDILFHPTGRLIQKREPYAVDMDAIIKTAKETGTILEIDSMPDRLDLKDEYIRKCVQGGVKMSIDSDAHNDSHFGFLGFGIGQARRGWAEKKDIINAWPLEKMLKYLK